MSPGKHNCGTRLSARDKLRRCNFGENSLLINLIDIENLLSDHIINVSTVLGLCHGYSGKGKETKLVLNSFNINSVYRELIGGLF